MHELTSKFAITNRMTTTVTQIEGARAFSEPEMNAFAHTADSLFAAIFKELLYQKGGEG